MRLCEEVVMPRWSWSVEKTWSIASMVFVLIAPPLFAQEAGGQNANGYVSGFGGAVWAGGNSTGSALFEGGVRVAPHVMVFTNVGRFTDLKADLQPSLDSAAANLSGEGIGVTPGGKLPAWYGVGGLRAEIPASKRVFPYLLGGLGAARLTPSPQLSFLSGTLPDGSVPDVGADVTATLVANGSFSSPPPSTALMLMFGGGAQVPLASHWAVDVGYRYSRIAADSTLSATRLNTNLMTFGFGYRF
jgi:opacity protein-like surface antigen